ncbi:uncharacterized protein B0H64DRAFT_472513 [Chaetomium fimeti]|uniref:Condensation domain-containing protein n=1 Tax=Chaetomium fimeti TaxID=1854472 RepID=A0AAE0LVQ2_9PEZI|nr:hypothetical protein B0H64DRAFT_472513 [Chaetomium fimeti]
MFVCELGTNAQRPTPNAQRPTPNARLREERREATRRFWESQRARFPDAANQLCLNLQRSTAQASQRSTAIPFPEARLAAAQARTGYMTIVYAAAAWALTLGTFMDADQVYFGMVLSGRDLPVPGALDVVGPLINMLPLSVQLPLLEGDRETSPSSVGAFVGRIRDDILGLNEVSHSETTDGFDRQFASIMGTQFEVAKGAGQVESPPADSNCPDMQSGVPLSLIVQGHSGLQILYSTARYSEEDMNNLRSVFENAMDCLLQGDDDERPLAPESKGDDLMTLFEGVVGRQPTAVAVTRSQGRDMTYDDFDRAAAAVARELSWIGANEPVCVYADWSVNWLDREDDYLAALGGHSIVQLQLAGRISSPIQRKISLRTTINNPVISRLAAAVDEITK